MSLRAAAQAATAKPDRVISIIGGALRVQPSKIKREAGTLIEFVLTSDDTDHGFRIPGAGDRRRDSANRAGEARVRFVGEERARSSSNAPAPAGPATT